MHPRLSLNSLSSASWALARDLELCERTGVAAVGLYFDKLEAHGLDRAVEEVRRSGLTVVHVFLRGPTPCDPSQWAAERSRALDAAHAARDLGATHLSLTAGPRGDLEWDAAVDALDEATSPLREWGGANGVRVGFEHTNPIRVDVGFIHSLRDLVDVCRRLGAGAVAEVNYCWAERDVGRTMAGALDVLSVVQLSDLVVPSTVIPDRAVPGDGVIPLGSVIATLLAAGYDGFFELEALGPRIEDEGYESAVARGLRVLSALLDDATVREVQA